MLGLQGSSTHISCVWALTAMSEQGYTEAVIEGGPGASVAGMLWGLICPQVRGIPSYRGPNV